MSEIGYECQFLILKGPDRADASGSLLLTRCGERIPTAFELELLGTDQRLRVLAVIDGLVRDGRIFRLRGYIPVQSGAVVDTTIANAYFDATYSFEKGGGSLNTDRSLPEDQPLVCSPIMRISLPPVVEPRRNWSD